MTTDPAGRATSGRDFLARLTGEPVKLPETEPAALGRGLLALAREAAELVRGYASEDPAIREAAHQRWAELNAMLPVDDASAPRAGGGLSKKDRARLRAALTQVVEQLEHLDRDRRFDPRTRIRPDVLDGDPR